MTKKSREMALVVAAVALLILLALIAQSIWG